MELSDFLREILSRVVDEKGLEEMNKAIEKHSIIDIDTARVEFQVFKDDKNYDCNISINSEGYDDGEIILIDCYAD